MNDSTQWGVTKPNRGKEILTGFLVKGLSENEEPLCILDNFRRET